MTATLDDGKVYRTNAAIREVESMVNDRGIEEPYTITVRDLGGRRVLGLQKDGKEVKNFPNVLVGYERE